MGCSLPRKLPDIAVVYSLFLEFIVYREVTFKKLREVIFNAMVTTASVTFIIATAAAFAWLIAIDGLPMRLAEWVGSINIPVWVFLIAFNAFFLMLGTFMESLSILIIIVPVLMPIFTKLGLDPLHMGVVLVLNLMIGLITPPVGMSLFVVSKVTNVRLQRLYKAIIPWMIPLVIVLLLITYVPELTTWLPNVVFSGPK